MNKKGLIAQCWWKLLNPWHSTSPFLYKSVQRACGWLLPGSLIVGDERFLLCLNLYCTMHNANACNFYSDPFLSKNSYFVYKCTAIHVTATWTPALARTTSLRKSVLPFLWLLPGCLPMQELLRYLKVFCHSCDFYLGDCLCKNSFVTWKCSAILVTSTWVTDYARTPFLPESVLPFLWLLPGYLPMQELLRYLKVFCHSCDFYLGACLASTPSLSKSVVPFMLLLPGSLTIR